MNKATLRMLNASEKELVRQSEPKRLKALDEDELLDLHARVRRARNKYSKLYRRRAAAQVEGDRSRARASKAHGRTATKAEIFEDALAEVSRTLAVVARDAAEELRAERLERARAAKAGSRPSGKGSKKDAAQPSKGSAKAKKKQRTPITERASASSRASTRRAQAKKAIAMIDQPVEGVVGDGQGLRGLTEGLPGTRESPAGLDSSWSSPRHRIRVA